MSERSSEHNERAVSNERDERMDERVEHEANPAIVLAPAYILVCLPLLASYRSTHV